MAAERDNGSMDESEGSAFGAPDLHLKDIIGVLIARRYILISSFLAAVLLVSVYAFTAKPIFTSTALVLIEPTKLNLGEIKEVYDPAEGAVRGDFTAREYFNTQMKLILNRSALEKTFYNFDFDRQDRFANAKDPVMKFGDLFTVADVRNTRLVRVSFDWEDPSLAREALKFLLNEYISATSQRAMGMTNEGLETLRLKAKELAPRVDAGAAALQDFMVANNMVSLEETQNIVVERLKQVNAELVRTENEKILYRSIVENLRNTKRDNVSLDSIPEAVESATIRDLKIQQAKTQQELSGLEGQYGASHPEVMSLRARLASLSQKMNSEIRIIFESAEQKYQRAEKQGQDLRSALSEQEKKVHALNQLATQYQKLKESHETLKETYRVVDKRIKEIEISLTAGPRSNNIFIVEPPTLPAVKSKPKRAQLIAFSMAGGLALGIMLSFFVEYFDTTIKTKEEAERITGFPVLGFVPPMESAESNGSGAGKPARMDDFSHWANSRSTISESFRSMRTSLDFFCSGERRAILVSSPSPGEGKTTVSLHIAISFAQAGKRTLLVDADMRKPRMGKIFKAPSHSGLSQLLLGPQAGGKLPREAINASPVRQFPKLSLLTSGPTPPNPAELLANGRMSALIAEWKKEYDVVIVDSPPVSRVTDAAILAKYVDACVFVIRNLRTERKVLQAAGHLLGQGCGRIGLALNHADMVARGYYDNHYYYYYYGGSYYGDSENGGAKPGLAGGLLEKLGLRA